MPCAIPTLLHIWQAYGGLQAGLSKARDKRAEDVSTINHHDKAEQGQGIHHQTYLSESFSHKAVLKGRAQSNSGLPRDADTEEHALMVEVAHDILHSLTLLADEVLTRDFDLVQLNIRGSRGDAAADLHSPAAHAFCVGQWNGHQGDTLGSRTLWPSTNSHGAIVGPYTVGDPFLRSIDNIVFTALTQRGGCSNVRNVRTCTRCT